MENMNRIDGYLRAIEQNKTNEYWDAQDRRKRYRKGGMDAS